VLTRDPGVIIFVFALLLATTLAFADGTRTWEQSKFEELAKGTADGVAIRSDGGLELAPEFKAVTTTPSAYIWSIATDRSGNLYAAAGTPARVYRITPDGKSTSIFESQELQVQALAVDDNGAVYAATNPDGKIYKLEAAADTTGQPKDRKGKKSVESGSTWSSSVYFDPDSKYIWDLALDKMGNLYVATGDHGEIFRVTPKGDHTLFFKSDEAQIRVLAFDPQGNLIAGSDGSGLVYRISASGEGFVLYSAPKKEITALAVDGNGNIYAAGVGEKRNAPNAPGLSISPSISSPAATSSGAGSQINLSGGPSSSTSVVLGNFSGAGSSTSGGSEIYRIAPDGAPARIWSSRDDLVYALAFGADGGLLAGTGNGGHIYQVRGEDQFTDLLKASASQVTAFAHTADGGLYTSTSNLGKIFRLGAGPDGEGTYQSDVFDAHIFSRWGRAEFRGTGKVELFARSGNVDNPDRNWSPWQKIEWQKNSEIVAPPARFIQWKAVLRAGNPPPRLDSVTINYLSKNVAPVFDDVTVQQGVRYQPLPKSSGDSGGNVPGGPRIETPPAPIHDRESIGVKFSVHDDNDDDMVYSIYYRGEGETNWLLLKDNLTDKFYSFDSSLLPDGAYVVKVVASDAPSHSPGQALIAQKESARFEVDTTPPRIEELKASVEGTQIHVTLRATDGFSPIARAEYSVDASDWQFVEPVSQISDSKTERYDFHADLATDPQNKKNISGDHVVVVRVYDRYDNMGSAKTVIGGR
jgi:sugar lactone lactonase YvrE